MIHHLYTDHLNSLIGCYYISYLYLLLLILDVIAQYYLHFFGVLQFHYSCLNFAILLDYYKFIAAYHWHCILCYYWSSLIIMVCYNDIPNHSRIPIIIAVLSCIVMITPYYICHYPMITYNYKSPNFYYYMYSRNRIEQFLKIITTTAVIQTLIGPLLQRLD